MFSHMPVEKRLHSLDLLNMGGGGKCEKISGKTFCHAQQRWEGRVLDFVGGHIAHGGPPTRETLPGLGRRGTYSSWGSSN